MFFLDGTGFAYTMGAYGRIPGLYKGDDMAKAYTIYIIWAPFLWYACDWAGIPKYWLLLPLMPIAVRVIGFIGASIYSMLVYTDKGY